MVKLDFFASFRSLTLVGDVAASFVAAVEPDAGLFVLAGDDGAECTFISERCDGELIKLKLLALLELPFRLDECIFVLKL